MEGVHIQNLSNHCRHIQIGSYDVEEDEHRTRWRGQSAAWQSRLQYLTFLHFEHLCLASACRQLPQESSEAGFFLSKRLRAAPVSKVSRSLPASTCQESAASLRNTSFCCSVISSYLCDRVQLTFFSWAFEMISEVIEAKIHNFTLPK